MTALPDPVWPVVVLASIQIGDAALCITPVACIAACCAAVQWPRRLWWSMPPLQRAAATGLVAGLWIPSLGAATCAALVVYFFVAIAMHVRARDVGRTLVVNALGRLLTCLAVGLVCFVVS